MNWQSIYNSIISKALGENRKKGNGTYYEKHHIIPKCIGGGNEKENLILLTAKEHFICHKLLFRIHPANKGIALSYYMMVYGKNKKHYHVSSRSFEEARHAAHIASNGKNNPRYGAVLSKETREKIRIKAIGRISPTRGTHHTQETKNKISLANKGLRKGIKKSAETRARMGKARIGIPSKLKGASFPSKMRAFLATNPNGIEIKFKGVVAAKKVIGSGVDHCLKGLQKTTHGWSKFKYVD